MARRRRGRADGDDGRGPPGGGARAPTRQARVQRAGVLG